jgi:two-component system response regulator RegA
MTSELNSDLTSDHTIKLSNVLPVMLIIDDDDTLLRVLSRAMSRRHFKVFTATTGEQAIALCKNEEPEYISLDLKLAEETGIQLIPKLKALNPNCKIVMLTAYASIATAVDAIKLGAHQYLCKPVDADQLLAGFDEPDLLSNSTEVQAQPTSVKRLEWERIQQALQNNDGNVSATARELGMHRRTLQRKLQKHPVRQ